MDVVADVEQVGNGVAAPGLDDRPGFRQLLRDAPLRRLWLAQTWSVAGDVLSQLAMPLFVYDLTGSARMVAAVALLLVLPRVILSPITGWMADQYDRRNLMIGSDILRLVLVIILPFTAELWQIGLLAVGIAIGNAVARPAEMAAVPAIAGAKRLVPALSLMQVTASIVRVAAPAAGAGVIAAVGPAPAFWLQGACFVGSLLALRNLSMPGPVRDHDSAREHPLRRALAAARTEMWAGVNAIRSLPIVRGVTAVEVLFQLAGGGIVVAGVVYTSETLGLGDRAGAAFALMTVAMSAGAVVGALLASRVEHKIGRARLMAIGYLGPFFLVTALAAPPMPVIYVAWFCFGFADAWAVIAFQSYLAEAVPGALRGRVYAAWTAIVLLGNALSFSLVGWLTPIAGAPRTLALTGIIVGVGAPLVLWLTGAFTAMRHHRPVAD